MRVVIFAPAIKASAIGRMASLVTRELTKSGHGVVVVRSEDASLLQAETHDFGVELVPWTKSGQVADLVRNAEALVYQIGDNYAYHCGSLQWLYRAPGIVCLHDFFVGHLFHGWAQSHKAEALACLHSWYGGEAAKLFFSCKNSEEFIETTKDVAPMTEWICSMAYGVITHSNWGIQRVVDSCPGPVQITPLAYDAPAFVSTTPSQRDNADQFNVLTVGHANPNKRAESVIRALGNSAFLREHATYRLVGQIQPAAAGRLDALAQSLKVHLVISGEVDADTLSQAIDQADAICCLRWPSLEAASASTVEAMLYGKPVIVTDTGFYSELPDTCVRKIGVQTEIPDLQQALEFLFINEKERLALGANAARWAAATFSAENYAHRLIEASLAVQRAAPMIKVTQSLVGQLKRWGATDSLMALRETIEPLCLFDKCQATTSNTLA